MPKRPSPFAKTRIDHATETAEDYVEAIGDILDQQPTCRVKDLAAQMEVTHVTVTRILQRLSAEGLIDKEQPVKDFYENKHLNSDLLAVNFTTLSDDEFHNALYFENRRLIRNYHEKHIALWDEQCRKLYFDKDVSFRGFR